MIKPLEGILFATDLSPDCQPAYEYAVSLGLRFNATVYILYIMDVLPENMEGRIKGLLGRHQWEDIIHTKEEKVRHSLTGKVTNVQLLNDIQSFCESVGSASTECGFQSREIIISTGDVPETIIKQAQENECDVIVMASREGLFARNQVSDRLKSVLKDSPIPVTVVPAKVG